MRATDLSPTPCTSENNATVTINVRRNERSPVFAEDGMYEATVREDLGENNRVTAVRARDDDAQVSTRAHCVWCGTKGHVWVLHCLFCNLSIIPVVHEH